MDSKVHCELWRGSYEGYYVSLLLPDCIESVALNVCRSWGESAGAISVSLHMLANGGNTGGLFRGGFMESGSPIPVGDITNGQVCRWTDTTTYSHP